MQPRQLTRPVSFGPDELRMIFAAYDGAWSEIAPEVGGALMSAESARMSLATIVLGLVNAEAMTPDGLRAMAVAVFCAKHRIDSGVDHGRTRSLRFSSFRSSAI